MAQDLLNKNSILTVESNNLAKYGFAQKITGERDFYFVKNTYRPMVNTMGKIFENGANLKDCIEGYSPANISGRHHFVPSKLVNGAQLPLNVINGVQQVRASADQERQEEGRVRRIYACLMESVVVKTTLYRELEEDFANDGLKALEYVKDCCTKRLTPELIAELEAKWQAGNCTHLNIPIDEHTIFVWAEWVLLTGEDFQPEKTYADCRIKFLTGLPPQLASEANVERMRPNPDFNFPNVYVASHVRAGQPHPYAGQCDPRKIRDAFTEIWCQKLKDGLVRRTPEAHANIADITDDYDDDVFYAAGKGRGKGGRGRGSGRGRGRGSNGVFSDTTRCYQCGGLGHIAKFTRDGVPTECPTKITIPRATLDAITYPHINRANLAEETTELPEDYNGPEPVIDATAHIADTGANWWD